MIQVYFLNIDLTNCFAVFDEYKVIMLPESIINFLNFTLSTRIG